jgi:hypothetical protein
MVGNASRTPLVLQKVGSDDTDCGVSAITLSPSNNDTNIDKRASSVANNADLPKSLFLNRQTLVNTGFLYLKPHCNTLRSREFVYDMLGDSDSVVRIVESYPIRPERIQHDKILERGSHFRTTAQYATALDVSSVPVPPTQFSVRTYDIPIIHYSLTVP